ncbi:FAD-dependent tricarballylate dehydrogenase TcuA [Pseudarthrobacter niigatensis]|uniref:Tricarballylate dehydrogenase n=1 Tax=Pseudarthrobacter niigatensis TaxID=369935 RepID=A0AAJ1ST17_9MICC|nr:FAD-dependent tricarballylate dehydrogenase TcuA [Pseudarthrobacter niigatensis]MDQ0145208.1 tricarballylate dehydrogenase [Pseudarthrobacter niigatensis]MDQ0266018.1 tricarballylate dehydrogenase [Pseudarthrobacter niigatensis]
MIKSDVLVVGGGNAGFTAALAAAERGRKVVLLEKAREAASGGNSFYTAGATRISHDGLQELIEFVEPDERHAASEVPAYTAAEYLADLSKVSEGRNDPELSAVLVSESNPTLRWLQGMGLKYRLMYERQAYRTQDGGYLFWGGLHVGNVGGGKGLMADHRAAAERMGVEVIYDCAATGLIQEDGRVRGVRYRSSSGEGELRAESVILASGGFEASPELRRRHLGEGWQNAKVRGTPGNTGEMILAALDAGAARGGDWSTCHSVAWDAWHPENEGNLQLTNQLTRGGYPLGIVVNSDGKRFVDEGADYRNYTYAKYGRDILAQPGSAAFQIFDASSRPMLRAEEYDMPGVSVVTAPTLAELAQKAGISPEGLEETVKGFNASITGSSPFDPNVKDGRRADTQPPKSNWARSIATGPFYAFPVTCGITFTFGGLKTDTWGRVLTEDAEPLEGLYACGEALGGLFSGNYPGGSGLAAGAVFGRRAGSIA